MCLRDCMEYFSRSGCDLSKKTVRILAVRGYYVDPGLNTRGKYDDAIFVVGGEKNEFAAFNGNTDPSAYRPGHGFGAQKGIATLKPGVHHYKVGSHKKIYPALVQAEMFSIYRDADGTIPPDQIVVIDRVRCYEDMGWFGINLHPGGSKNTGSLGCQTIYAPQWDECISLVVNLMKKYSIKQIEYVLVEK